MGSNSFAPGIKQNTFFVVQNITTEPKVVRIFNYPILPGATRDLLMIPGVAESDIRASLLKGEIQNKLLVRDIIIVQSDIDLLQFDTAQYTFLTSFGITTGTQVTPAQSSGFPAPGSITYVWKQQIIPIGTTNGTNRTFFTPDIFLDGSYNGNIFHITVEYNGRQLVKNIDYTLSLTGIGSGGFNTINFIAFSPETGSQLYTDYTVKQ